MLDKIRYWFYSRKYKKIYDEVQIQMIRQCDFNYSFKINNFRIFYIRETENKNFKMSKALLKECKMLYHKKLF